MERDVHAEAKKTMDEIAVFLKDETLSDEERRELELQQAKLAGALLRDWLPLSLGR